MTTPNSQDKNATDLKGKKGLRRLINATGYSMKGLSAAYRNEAASCWGSGVRAYLALNSG